MVMNVESSVTAKLLGDALEPSQAGTASPGTKHC